jgi:hypothetical protein
MIRVVPIVCLLVSVLSPHLGVAGLAAGGDRVTGLRCEDLRDPNGIDAPRPRLSWILESWRVHIPANTTATLAVPAHLESRVTEGGRPASPSTGVRLLGVEGPRSSSEGAGAIHSVGAGDYAFEAR